MGYRRRRQEGWLDYVLSFVIYLFFRIDRLIYSLPAWAALVAHFTFGLSIFWFWIIIGVWFLGGVLRYLLISFGRWGAASPEPQKKNINPYSKKKEN